MRKIVFIIIALAPLLSACNKGNTGGGKIGFRRRMLTAHNWRITGMQVNGKDVTIPAGEKDNVYNFNDNENGYMDEETLTCDSATAVLITGAPIPTAQGDGTAPRRINYMWSTTGDQRYIYIKNFGSTDYNPEWFIVDMDTDYLVVEGTDIRDGVHYQYQKTFATSQQ